MVKVLKNEDLFLENISVYKNSDLYYVQDALSVGIMSICQNEVRKYFVYVNDEFGGVEFRDEFINFENALTKAKDYYKEMLNNYKNSLKECISVGKGR